MKILETNDIRKEFGNLVAVKDVNLMVEKGQVLGLIGPNGAGKTTLLRTLSTVLRPTSGTANLMGYDLKKDFLKIRKHIGFMPDFFNLYSDLTIEECLKFFAKAYKVEQKLILEKIDEVLNFVDLEEKRSSFIRHLSRGMVQRMGVAVSLVHEPEIFLLDEPASGLDPKARIQLRSVLKKLSTEGKTIIISSHILTELSGFCSHIAIMNKGKIIMQGAVDEVQRRITSTQKIRISVLENQKEATDIINNFPDIKIIGTEGNTIILESSATLETIAQLNKTLVENDIRVFSLHEEKMDLEDLFMKISSNSDKPV